jgi:elongation factor Ts
MNITAADVNKLRQQTGAGMMDCKQALQEAQGDFEQAVDILRKKGQKVAAKRSDREAGEGVVIASSSADGTRGALIVLNCETDFVAKNEGFVGVAQTILNAAINSGAADLEALGALPFDESGRSIGDKITDEIGKIGEKIDLSQYDHLQGGKVVAYIHPGNRLATLVAFNKATTDEIGKDVAMQIAAMNPVAVDADSVPAEVVEREKAIVIEQIRNDPKMAGKPEQMITNIANGKLNAFFKESTLLAQAFVKDGSKSVGDYLKSVDGDLKVVSFKRIALG